MMHKPTRRFAALAATSLVLSGGLFAAGCGSSGGNHLPTPSPPITTTIDPAGALRDVQTGQDALNRVLTQTGTPSASDLQSVSASFASAHAKNPNNAEAATLLGLLQISAAAEDVASVLSSSASSGKAAPLNLRIGNLPALKNALLSPRLVLRSVLAAPLLASGKTGGIGRAAVDGAKLRAALQNLQNAITNALPLIQQGANKTDFAFTLADFETGTGSPRVMDQADVTAILAALYDTRASLQMGLAYNTDTNGFDFSQTVGQRFANKNAGDTITPDEYLPPAPFGTLLGGGKTNFAQAKSDLIAGADTAQTALTRLQNRSGSALHLIDTSDVTSQQYAEAGLALVGVKASLAGPVTIPLGGTTGSSVTLNLKAWFDNPPQNVRALLPTYTIGVDNRTGANILQASAASYPDLTFGGLVTGTSGLDASLFTATVQSDQSVGELLGGFLNALSGGGS